MTRHDPIRAVIFDVGNVLYQWDIRHLYAKLIPDPTQLEHFVTHVVTPIWHFQHDAGRPLKDMVGELLAKFPQHEDLINAYVPRWLETIPGPVPGSLQLVDQLAARNIPIFGITNFGEEFWAMFRPTAPVFDHFSDIIVSGTERLVKPDPQIYQLAFDRFGIQPSSSLFIDDRLDNIESAQNCGLQVHHFSDAATLEKDLQARGLL